MAELNDMYKTPQEKVCLDAVQIYEDLTNYGQSQPDRTIADPTWKNSLQGLLQMAIQRLLLHTQDCPNQDFS